MHMTNERSDLRARLTGPIGSVRTPFLQNGEIDFTALRQVVDFMVEAGSSAVMLTYGDSLFSLLSECEVADVTRSVIQQTSGRVPVIAADGGWSTSQTLRFAEYAAAAGADVLMLMPPAWSGSVTPATLAEHYRAVSAHIPVMIVTNVLAAMSRVDALEAIRITMETAPRVVAVKDDLCEEFGRRLAWLVRDRLAVIAGGQKQNHLNAWPYGCKAYLSAFITFNPSVARSYWSAIQTGQAQRAAELVSGLDVPFFDCLLALRGGFDAGMHGILEACGLAGRWRRPPYASLSDQELELLKHRLQEIGAL